MAQIRFYPIGNADSSLFQFADGRLMLMDFCNAFCGTDNGGRKLADEVRSFLQTQKRTSFDVVCFSHGDSDHVDGSDEFFYFEHDPKYQSEDRIRIDELWVPACFILDDDTCEAGQVIRNEARHRLRLGKGVRVFGFPLDVDRWLLNQGILASQREHLIVHAGNCISGFDAGDGQVEIFVHSPFSDSMQDFPDDRNKNCIVLHFTFFESGRITQCIMGADAIWETWAEIVNISEYRENQDRLDWDLFHISHHASYLSLSSEKGDTETVPAPEVDALFMRGSIGGLLVCPSKPTQSIETVQPPHFQAVAYYKRVARSKGGEFLVTDEWPKPSRARPIVVETSVNGFVLKRDSSLISGSPAILTSPSPRFGQL